MGSNVEVVNVDVAGTGVGVPVPDEPFPHVNDRAEFQTHAQRAQVMGRT